MIKVAIFTEGLTEQLFMCEAISQLAGDAKYYITNERRNGKGDKLVKIQADPIGEKEGHELLFQILNCDSDSQVLSTIREEYETLVAAGFTYIIGLRDLRPLPKDKLARLFENAAKYAPKGAIEPLIVISVVEVEAWFIAENSHFLKIDASLTPAEIAQKSGIDITGDSEEFDQPFERLQEIYAVAGKGYTKSRADIASTIGVLDILAYTAEAGDRARTAQPLIGRIQQIFAASSQQVSVAPQQ